MAAFIGRHFSFLYLVRIVFDMNVLKRIGIGFLFVFVTIDSALATLIYDAQGAITGITNDSTIVGGYVVSAVAVIAGVGIILSLVRKV
ncbi:MAG: hypothetical protein WAW41_04080 [Methylobacter sp.]